VAELIACKDASLFEAFSCSWTSSSIFYKLLEIERTDLGRRACVASRCAAPACCPRTSTGTPCHPPRAPPAARCKKCC